MDKLRAILFLLLVCPLAKAATWYVDVAATGSNNGTSWANAWTDVTYTDRDTNAISAGDTVFIKGGVYPSTQVWRPKEGSGGTWTRYYFTNGLVTLYRFIQVRAYTELNGQATANYETNLVSTFDTLKITNNCNLWLNRMTNWYNVGSGGRSITVLSDPVKFTWIHITGTSNRYASDPPYFQKSDSASEIFFDLSGTTTHTNELGYIWIDQSSGHGAGAAITLADMGTGFGCFNIHHSLFENNGSDVCNHQGSLDYHHNIIRNRQGLGAQGCNDTFTISGATAYIRIHHNLIEPADNSLYYLWGAVSNIHDFYFYGNLATPVRPGYYNTDPNTGSRITVQGSGVQEQDVFTGPMYYIVTNVIFANNTWPTTTNDGPGGIISFGSKNAASTGNTNGFTILDGAMIVKNNLFVEFDTNAVPNAPRSDFSFFPFSAPGYGTNDAGQGWSYTTNSIVFDYNQATSYYPGNAALCGWGPYPASVQTLITNATDAATILGYAHNSSAALQFVDAYNWDFRPATAPSSGQDLSSLLSLMPDVDKDLYGNTRANWMGAIDFGSGTSNLVLWLTFNQDDGWTTNHVITDHSGKGNHAYYEESTNRNTWPTWVAGPNGLNAAQFEVNYTNSFRYGTYAAITSLSTNPAASGLETFTNGTWALWANIDNAHVGVDTDDIFLSAGQDQNTWNFGKYYADGPSFYRATTSGGQEPLECYARWPDVTTNSGWQHYAITWDGTNWTPYLNGQPYTTSTAHTNANSSPFSTTWTGTLVSTNSVGQSYNYIAVGVNSHGGTPAADDADGLPNNGQLWGRLADVRIYNRALSAAEILSIYGSSSSAVVYGPFGRWLYK